MMVKRHQIIIPNGRIIVKQKKKASTGPMGMFVDSDEEKLLTFAKELGRERMEECKTRSIEEYNERRVKERKRKRN